MVTQHVDRENGRSLLNGSDIIQGGGVVTHLYKHSGIIDVVTQHAK